MSAFTINWPGDAENKTGGPTVNEMSDNDLDLE
jgi:hypothetical protein